MSAAARSTAIGPSRVSACARSCALEELHHHVRSAGVEPPDVEHARDVLALEPRGRPRLAQESLDGFVVVERVVADELDRDELIELLVARGDDDPHPADPEEPLDAVLARQHVALADLDGAELRSSACTITKHTLASDARA